MTQAPMDWEGMLVEKAMASEAFKRELLGNPKAAIAKEIGQALPENVDIVVLEQTPKKLYLVLPLKVEPEETASDELSDEELEAVAGGGIPRRHAAPPAAPPPITKGRRC